MRRFWIDIEHLESCLKQFSELDTGGGTRYSVTSSVDHPAFEELRNFLERENLIDTWRQVSNGDRTLETFMLNDYVFKEGERFPCASALGVKFKCAEKRKKEPLDDKLFEVI